MYIEPCVRLAMRISPKMSEKPAASRNSSPPSARLFNVWMIQYCIRGAEKVGAGVPAPLLFRRSRLEVLRRRPVARVHRVLQELVGVVGPELAHVRIGLDHRVDQPPLLARHLADVDVADDVAVLVESDG